MVGSAILLLVLSPILLVIAMAIKLTSEGPVFFAQERLGQFGTRFKCLKFRTMYANNDPKIHREYVERFIAGKAKEERKRIRFGRLQDHGRSAHHARGALAPQDELG